jgi:flagellar protein FliS
MSPVIDKAKYYARMQVETSAKPRLICMLHERGVQLIRSAMENDSKTAKANLIKAQNILAQLERSLKRTDDVSNGLFYLYDYCYCMLEKDEPEPLSTALELMITLRDTFEKLLKKDE